MKTRIFWIIALTSLFFVGCEAEIDQYTPSSGNANMSVYVALGNSITAGFADGELFLDGQTSSYPNILAEQFRHVGLEEFNQPLMLDNLGFGNRLVLGVSNGSLSPVPVGGTPNPLNFLPIGSSRPFHNMGVPGATTMHLLVPGYGMLNPYYGRFARDLNEGSILGDALAINPTFFSLWIGANDILGFAMSGGEGSGITPAIEFAAYYEQILLALRSGGVKGVVANIPDITSIPFFNTIPFNALVLEDANQVAALNQAYAGLPHIEFQLGPNGFVVEDQEHAAGIRQLQPGEKVLLTLPLGKVREEGWGSAVPVPAQYYLSTQQVMMAIQAVKNYNDIILELANVYEVAHVDANASMQQAEPGLYFDGIAFNTEFVTGGLFSLDGVHLTARGNAIITNDFIDAINRKYNASIPRVSVTQYDGIVFP